MGIAVILDVCTLHICPSFSYLEVMDFNICQRCHIISATLLLDRLFLSHADES